MANRIAGWFMLGGLLAGYLALPETALGQDFRVETEVLADGEKEPISESLTLFMGDVVYDFMLSPSEETTIFDVRRGTLTLIDPVRGWRTSLTTAQLEELSAAMKSRGLQGGPPDLFQPQFQTTYESDTLRLSLVSERLVYRAKGIVSRHPDGAERYRRFADWHSRLNAMRKGNIPPFGRLELNQGLAQRNLLPQEIERTVTIDRALLPKTAIVKSKHTVTWLVSNTDRKRIEQAGQQLVSLTEVPPPQYWEEPLRTAREK